MFNPESRRYEHAADMDLLMLQAWAATAPDTDRLAGISGMHIGTLGVLHSTYSLPMGPVRLFVWLGGPLS